MATTSTRHTPHPAVRGIKTGVTLYPTVAPPAAADNTTVTLSAVMPKYPVPSANWSLACVNLPLPTDKPYHIIAYQGFNTSKVRGGTAGVELIGTAQCICLWMGRWVIVIVEVRVGALASTSGLDLSPNCADYAHGSAQLLLK